MNPTNWKVKIRGQEIPASVPGDVTIDAFKAGLIPNPYLAENYKQSVWIGKENVTYTAHFDVDETLYQKDQIVLTFKGIDLFSTVVVNGQEIGHTRNAFLAYSYSIKEYCHPGDNILEVKMESTLNKMDEIDTSGYRAIFNLPRIFLRKPQCHFGWDWAPKICAYGIIDTVCIEGKNDYQITDVHIIADQSGNTRIHVDVNYDNKDLLGPDDMVLKKSPEPKDDTIIYYVSKTPFGKDYEKKEMPLMGRKNYWAYHKENAQLWWPSGYGKQPLYSYRIELWRDHQLMDVKEGRFAYRSVELKEEPKGNNLIGFDFYINGVRIYLKGSNWVPPECFTGVMRDDKYAKLIDLAKKMNANILRVWGGGAYEKDIFYDYCDEAGLLVWQDVALACGDIPEDNKEFVDNLLEEVNYQVKRLRNHPSLIYWCGGNEKTGTYGNCITHGDYLVNCVLYGVIRHLDETRPYRRQSPHGYTDIGNNPMSGDSHYGVYELALNTGMKAYRHNLAGHVVPFVSECAIMGPSSEETLRKIFPEDHLWPMDEMWKDRFMENPYAAIVMDFPHRELYYAEQLHGKVRDFHDFILKGMSAHSEGVRAELDYSRGNREVTGAWLNWMFDDIWPSGTWSTVDYYLEPKQAYYTLRKHMKPLLASCYFDQDQNTYLFVDNQTRRPYHGQVSYEVKTYEGKVLGGNSYDVKLNPDGLFKAPIKEELNEKVYVHITYQDNGTVNEGIYSPAMFIGFKPKNKYTYETKVINSHKIEVTFHAESFVKSLFIHFPNNFAYQYSDNYLDLEKGQKKTVEIISSKAIDPSKMILETLNV